jgi:vitamin B12 transporter
VIFFYLFSPDAANQPPPFPEIRKPERGSNAEIAAMKRKVFFTALMVGLLSTFQFSLDKPDKETPPHPLQHEIVVTATRLETPAKEVASSITVITRADLKKANKATVLEVLGEVPGLTIIQNGGKGAAANIFLRGSNSEHTLVLMDGVELNDPMNPSRSYDLAHLTLENVEQIEILLGPQSTLYGSDAMGGVINIITKKGEGRPKVVFSTSAGTYRTINSSAGLSGAAEKTNYSLGISYLQTGGISAASSSYPGNTERDGYRNLSFSGRLGFTPKNNLNLDFVVRALSTKTDIDNFGGPHGDDPNNVQFYRSLFVKGQVRTLWLKNRWEQKLGAAFITSRRENENDSDEVHPFDKERGFFKSRLIKIDWQNNFFLHKTNTLTLGADYEEEQGDSEYTSWGAWGPYESLFPLQKAAIAGIYIQDQIRLASRFFATVGARFDRHSQTGQAFTYRLAPAYFIGGTGTKIKATLGTAFKSPSLYQLYAPGTIWGKIGNSHLKPEQGKGWDLGIEQQFYGGKLLAGATYFNNSYKNLINFEMVRGYINIGNAFSRGVELSIQAQPLAPVLFKASYTRMEARDRDQNTRLLRRPEEKFCANLDYRLSKKGHLNLSLMSIGRRDDVNYAVWPYPQITLPAYSLLNAALSYEFSSKIRAFVNLENILNTKYEMIYGYETPGFSAFIGFKLNY